MMGSADVKLPGRRMARQFRSGNQFTVAGPERLVRGCSESLERRRGPGVLASVVYGVTPVPGDGMPNCHGCASGDEREGHGD